MNELFNWEGETPEQRQARLQWEHELLLEQARKRFNMIVMTGGAAGGGGGGSDTGCLPPGGLILTLETRGEVFKIFLSEVGTENGKTLYANYTVGSERGQEFEGWFVVSWNPKANLWSWAQISTEIGGYTSELIATSPDLYADVWTMVSEEYPPVGTSPGEEFSCDWRYCVTYSGDGFSLTSSAYASWNEIPLTEPPNAYALGEGGSIFWSPEDSSWVAIPGEDPILLGGTREDLPTGTFDLGGGQTLTVNSGICAVEPVPTPEPPTPGSTDFIIRIDTTLGDGLDSFAIGVDTKGLLYNYDVAWEEVGNSSNSGTLTNQIANVGISFPSPGRYDISISGLFPAYKANTEEADSSANKVIDIIQWGDNQWQSMIGTFRDCQNLNKYSATDTPNLSYVSSMNMSYMFSGAREFNGDISGWDVGNVTNMDFMFSNAQAFNQDLSGWCVSLIPSEPGGFGENTIAWELPKPVWGTCPGTEEVKKPK